MDNDRIEAFWRSYLDTLPAGSPVRDEQYAAEGFGDSSQMADGKMPIPDMPLVCERFRVIYE